MRKSFIAMLVAVVLGAPAHAACPNSGICFFGNKIVDFSSYVSTTWDTTSGNFINDGAVPVGGALNIDGTSSGGLEVLSIPYQSTIWIHWTGIVSAWSYANNYGYVTVYDGINWIGASGHSYGGVDIRQQCAGGSRSGINQLAGSNRDIETLHTWDMQITFGTSGSVNLYMDGSLATTMSYTGETGCPGATTWGTAPLNIYLGVPNNSGNSWFSEVFVATFDTRGYRVASIPPGSNNATFAWTGSYANVNGNAINDSSYISTTATGNIAGLNGTPAFVGGVWNVAAVKETIRGASGPGAPNTIYAAVKPNGGSGFSNGCTNTFTSTFANYWCYMTTNPATSTYWSQSDLANIAYGPAD